MKIVQLESLCLRGLQGLIAATAAYSKFLLVGADTASDPNLKTEFSDHTVTTDGQLDRLEAFLEELGEKPRGKSEEMDTLIQCATKTLGRDTDKAVADLDLICRAQGLAHLQISLLDTLCMYAEWLRRDELVELLGEFRCQAEDHLVNLSEIAGVVSGSEELWKPSE